MMFPKLGLAYARATYDPDAFRIEDMPLLFTGTQPCNPSSNTEGQASRSGGNMPTQGR
jgi:hypothetical protein